MIILGISFLADASAALLIDDRLLCAISEERLNRIKLWHGVPHRSIEWCLAEANITIQDVDMIACHGRCAAPDRKAFDLLDKKIACSEHLSPSQKLIQRKRLKKRFDHEQYVLTIRTPEYIRQIEDYGRPLFLTEHHTAHAASAFFGSGWSDCFVLTADGWGEDASSTLWECQGATMEKVAQTETFNSLGYFYGAVTKSLGFQPHRHEGKVLGLAAYVDKPSSYPHLQEMISCDSERMQFIGHMEKSWYQPNYDIPELVDLTSEFSREDVAAAAQQRLEEVVTEYVSHIGEPTKKIDLAVAGGIFANVRLNQHLRELPNVSQLSIFPNMGDGGLSIGAAWLAFATETKATPEPLASLALGEDINDEAVELALRKSELRYERIPDIETETARLLASGEIVARCSGKMEFGPRALGNRSILYRADDPSVNHWLNVKLNRSEFMPFAPAVRLEDVDACFHGHPTRYASANYMTMTFNCTDIMCAEAPAAIHVDQTARPQIVSKSLYPELHKIISKYKEMTGFRSLINTSFNMHEEPIVRSSADALRAFQESGLPYLVLGNYLVQAP